MLFTLSADAGAALKPMLATSVTTAPPISVRAGDERCGIVYSLSVMDVMAWAGVMVIAADRDRLGQRL